MRFPKKGLQHPVASTKRHTVLCINNKESLQAQQGILAADFIGRNDIKHLFILQNQQNNFIIYKVGERADLAL